MSTPGSNDMNEKLNTILHRIDMSFYILLVVININITTIGCIISSQNTNLLSNIKQIKQALNIYEVEK